MFRRNKGEIIDDVSFISEGMKVHGSIETVGNVRVDGMVHGGIKAGGNVTIGEKGLVEGDIHAKTMTIGGKVFGSVVVHEKLILEDASRLTGDIFARVLVIEEGANFSGKCDMKSGASDHDMHAKPVTAKPAKSPEQAELESLLHSAESEK